MYIVCSDLESVFIPEVWVTISKATGINELQFTTRDIPDYDALMKQRLQILLSRKITLHDVQTIIKSIKPLEGALPFLNWLRRHFPTIILTDSFFEFVAPIMSKLEYPTVFCNSLDINERGFIDNYRLREQNGKMKALRALKSLKFQTIAIGDSYNDVDMLKEADVGILFKPSKNIVEECSGFKVANSYDELRDYIAQYKSF